MNCKFILVLFCMSLSSIAMLKGSEQLESAVCASDELVVLQGDFFNDLFASNDESTIIKDVRWPRFIAYEKFSHQGANGVVTMSKSQLEQEYQRFQRMLYNEELTLFDQEAMCCHIVMRSKALQQAKLLEIAQQEG